MSDKTANLQHTLAGIKEHDSRSGFVRTHHPDAQWFENAGLGLFIHWGLSTVHGGVDLSWGMMAATGYDKRYAGKNKVTPTEYFALADQFQPDSYQPERWLAAARDAGFRYAIMNTRHHDGYALWPSRYGDFNTGTKMGGRDLVKPFLDACRKLGLKAGLYYSPPDWYYTRYYMNFGGSSVPALGLHHEPVELPREPDGFREEYHAYLRGQVEELLTLYGRVDILWFDGGPEVISIEEIRRLQLGILVNPRMHGYGDFETPENRLPVRKPEGWWEVCERWNFNGWGHQRPTGYKSLHYILHRYAKIRAWGGNYLLSCAPLSDGDMPDIYYRRMAEMRDWMAHSGESVMDVCAGPYPEHCNVPVTVKGNTAYLHIVKDFSEPEWDETGEPYGEEVILTDVDEPECVLFLQTGEELVYVYKVQERELRVPMENWIDTGIVIKVVWREGTSVWAR